MKKKSKFKKFKVMKSTSNTKFNHYLLSSTLNDKFGDVILMFWI